MCWRGLAIGVASAPIGDAGHNASPINEDAIDNKTQTQVLLW
jgi:hypothetical protein